MLRDCEWDCGEFWSRAYQSRENGAGLGDLAVLSKTGCIREVWLLSSEDLQMFLFLQK